MASNIKAHGVDLDAIFMPRGSATARPAVGYKVLGVDISDRYYPSSYPSIDDRPPADTDIKAGGTDLRNLFRWISFAGGGAGPTITSQPTSLTLPYGAFASFAVGATGTGTLSYQWRKEPVTGGSGPVNIPGATASNYNIPSVVEADDAFYSVVVTDSTGSTTSINARLNAGNPAIVTVDPVGGTIAVGAVLSLSVTAIGDGFIIYQWRKNGTNISGANSPTYSYTTTSTGDSGNYDCVVSNIWGTDTSAAAVVVVGTGGVPPSISANPVGGTITVGDVLNLEVDAAGSPPLSYQWRKNGTNISGATSDTYTYLTTSTGDSGNYDCVITNPYGTVTSAVASVTVTGVPTGTPPTITSHPAGGTVHVGDVINLVCAATGDPTLTYTWQKFGVSSWVNIGSGTTYTTTATHPSDGGDYRCVVTNPYGIATSSTANVTVLDIAPVITGGTVTGGPYVFSVGNLANFTVTATGTNLTYIWTKNGVPTGHTGPAGPSFLCSGSSDDGTYAVSVSNSAGSDSASTTLTVV